MTFCLLPDKVETFKKALKEKEISLADLVNMESADRIKLLEPYAGTNAKAISTAIEEKLILKNKVLGLTNLLNKLIANGKYSPEKVTEIKKSLSEFKAKQMERVFNPKEGQAFYSGIAEKFLGTEIPKEAVKKVWDLQTQMDKVKNGNNLSGVSDEYLLKHTELNDYISSFKPLTAGQSIAQNLAIWGRNSLLANPSTPIKASENQLVNSIFEGLTRRFTSRGGAVSDLASQASTEAWRTFKKTGLNTAGMESMDDSHLLGKGENFKVPNVQTNRPAGITEKIVRTVAQVSNKVVIDWAHNVPFTKFYQMTFFDSANFTATNLARNEGLKGIDLKNRTAEIFKDAVKIEPQTIQGKQVRMEAQQAAARITSTNPNIAASLSLYIKNSLNKIGREYLGGFPIGDFLIPIAKIPPTVIANKIYNAGVGMPFAIVDLFKGYAKLENPTTQFEGLAQVKKGWQGLARIVGAVGLGVLLALSIKKEDFRKDNYGNSFVRIGGVWINTEYASFLSPAFVGAVQARFSTDKSLGGEVKTYSQGVSQPLKALPGVSEISDLFSAVTTGKEWKYLNDFFASRGIPAIGANLFKDRPVNRLLFGAHGVETTQEVKADNVASAKKATQTKKTNNFLKSKTSKFLK